MAVERKTNTGVNLWERTRNLLPKYSDSHSPAYGQLGLKISSFRMTFSFFYRSCGLQRARWHATKALIASLIPKAKKFHPSPESDCFGTQSIPAKTFESVLNNRLWCEMCVWSRPPGLEFRILRTKFLHIRQPCQQGVTMNIIRLAALLALASIPLLLSRKEKGLNSQPADVDSEHIFDEELAG
jgi:hypothetical protein